MSELIKRLRWLLTRLVGDYLYFVVYTHVARGPQTAPTAPDLEVSELSDLRELESSPDAEIRELVMYHGGPETRCFVARRHGHLVAGCWVWSGEHYRRKRNYWPLRPGEGKLIALVTVPAYRGQGIAAALVADVARRLHENGFHLLFARIWHSYRPSRQTFEKAGWRRYAHVVDLYPGGRRYRLIWPCLGRPSRTRGATDDTRHAVERMPRG